MRLNSEKILILAILILIILTGCKKNTFSLEEKYDNSKITEIDNNEFDELLKNKESFVVFIYETSCITSNDFSKMLTEFSNKNKISLYKMSFADMKNTELNNKIKFYPSLVLFNKGVLVDYLDAEADDDKEYYKNVDGLESWFSKYVTIR